MCETRIVPLVHAVALIAVLVVAGAVLGNRPPVRRAGTRGTPRRGSGFGSGTD